MKRYIKCGRDTIISFSRDEKEQILDLIRDIGLLDKMARINGGDIDTDEFKVGDAFPMGSGHYEMEIIGTRPDESSYISTILYMEYHPEDSYIIVR